MNKIVLYYNKGLGKYFYTGDRVCCQCNKEITKNIALFIDGYNLKPKASTYFIVCIDCRHKIKLPAIQQRKLVLLVSAAPEGSIPVFIKAPSLADSKGGLDVFSAATQLHTDKTTDNTIYAGRASLEGASVGDKKYLDNSNYSKSSLRDIVHKEKKLNSLELKSKIDDIKNWKIVDDSVKIENKDKKLLE